MPAAVARSKQGDIGQSFACCRKMTSTKFWSKQGDIGQCFGRCSKMTCTKLPFWQIISTQSFGCCGKMTCTKLPLWQIVSTPKQFKGASFSLAFTNRKYFPSTSRKFHVYSERSVFWASGRSKKWRGEVWIAERFFTMEGLCPWV